MLDTVASDEKRLNNKLFDEQLNQRRQVKLKTCADVYDYWRNYKRSYKKAPKDGVEFQLEYIDTGLALSEESRASAPIALALHGAPGSYHDFTLLIRHLAEQNVRVIAPNFPEYIATVRTKVLFRHSADEKAAYLRDFLKAVGVRKIDLLISHSSAIFPTLLILLNANNQAIAAKHKSLEKQHNSNNNNNKDTSERDYKYAPNQLVSAADNNKTGAAKLAGQSLVDNRNTQLDSAQNQEPPREEEEEDDEDEQDTSTIPAHDDEEQGRAEVEEAGESDREEEQFEDAREEVDDNNNKNLEALAEQEAARQAAQARHPAEALNQAGNTGTGQEPDRRRNKKKSSMFKKGGKNLDVIVKFDEPIEIKAVALFNPAGHRMPKSMRPTWFKCNAVHAYQHKLGRSLFRKLGPAFLTVVGVPVRVDNMDNVMLSATVMRNSRMQRVVTQLEQLSEMKVPTLLVFSENDKLIEKEIFYEMTRFMKLDPNNFDIFKNDGNIELSQSRAKDWIRVMVFKAGGHYAYSNYATTVNKAVSELLEKVTQEGDNSKPVESC